MVSFFRVRLGSGNSLAEACRTAGYVGTGYEVLDDLSDILSDDLRVFNEAFRPIYHKFRPNKSKASAATVGGIIWRVSIGIEIGDIVISPTSNGNYLVGEVTGDYQFSNDGVFPHKRPVRWFDRIISQKEVSDTFKLSIDSRNTVISVDQYANEIEALITGRNVLSNLALDENLEDLSTFVMEKHLEEFLVANWEQSELGRNYDIYEENGELVGQQYMTDTGPLDILAISKNKETWLVVELKKGRASDAVVGQIMRYMGYVQDELADAHQEVRGAIIALEDSQRMRRARSIAPNIDFYRYQINFKLIKE